MLSVMRNYRMVHLKEHILIKLCVKFGEVH